MMDYYYSFFSDVYSSHTSSSFSPSLSDGVATPNSLIQDTENNHRLREDDDDENEAEQQTRLKKIKYDPEQAENGKCETTSNGIQSNGDGTYHCQFCDKSFPRLGYLKKHEQVCK